MSFDKVKAMRDAERFLAQGKLRAAISEYKRVVEADKSDFNTLNMLGDLYVKASEPDEAVKCFSFVAEHYSKQGFAQKAIAIYNKISRLKPDSIEVSSKLAQLYQMKGSFAEARTHYTTVAEQYTKTGKKTEALNVWKQIANLDPNNTDIYLKIADACWQDQQKEEAANAYIEAGNRLTKKNQFESAITAFSRALEIRPDDLPALRGYVKSQIGLGFPDDAAKSLESSLARQPHSREIINLLADCYIEAGNLTDAEKTVVQLVEKEPTNYPKLLEVFEAYLKARNINSATRILTMVSEHMLVGGQAIELEQKINKVLEIDPDDLDAIRLLVRFNNWQRDETGIKTSMERLAESAKLNNAIEDERYALSQLVLLVPQNIYFAQRLQELNLADGYTNGIYENYKSNNGSKNEIPTFESYTSLGDEEDSNLAEYKGDLQYVQNDQNESLDDNYQSVSDSEEQIENKENLNQSVETSEIENVVNYRGLSEFEKHGLQTEIEGIDFYIEQGFYDLAEKTLDEIEERFGIQPEINTLREILKTKNPYAKDENLTNSDFPESNNAVENESLHTNQFAIVELTNDTQSENINQTEAMQDSKENGESSEIQETQFEEFDQTKQTEEFNDLNETENEVETDEEFADVNQEPNEQIDEKNQFDNSIEEVVETNLENERENPTLLEESKESQTVFEENNESKPKIVQVNPFEAMKSELSSPEPAPTNSISDDSYDDDFETSYQTGIVYREMGLIEDSIREFQDAIKRVTPQDGTRRFFLCCNMLGLCFMEKNMPTIAIMWMKQGLDCNHLSDFELNGMRYELANAYETAGELEKARQIFEEIYAVDVSFRDVGTRLNNLLSK